MGAENTTTRVVQVEVDNAEAIKMVAEYNAKIEESTAKEKALREEIKKKGAATDADRESLAKYKAEQTAYKTELREVEKEVQNNIRAARAQEDSNIKLRAQLSNLTREFDNMGAVMQKSAKGDALKKQINEITDALNESEQGTQRFYRNVGNYPNLQPLETQFGEIKKQLAMMKFEGKENTEEFRELMGVASQMKDALADTEASINAGASDTAQLDALIKSTQTVLQLYAQWAIISDQLGIKNESLDKTFQIITTTLGALIAVQSIQNMLQAQSIVVKTAEAATTWLQTKAEAAHAASLTATGVASKIAAAGTWLFNAALNANPIGLIMAAIVACVAVVYGLVKAFSFFFASSESAKESFKKQGEELDKLNKKYDEHIEKMKATGKTDAEVANERLALARDMANKRAAHFAEAKRLYDDDEDKYTDALEAKKKADEDYQAALRGTANSLRAIGSAYDNKQLEKKLGAVKYATEKANDRFVEQIKTLQILRGEGAVTASEYNELLRQLDGDREQSIRDAQQSAAEKRRQQLDVELTAVRTATDAQIALLKDGIAKDRQLEDENYKRKIEDLKKRLTTEKNLTKTARAAIEQQIRTAEQQHTANMAKLDAKAITERLDKEAQAISLKLAAVKKGSDEEFSLRMEQLNKQAQVELNNASLTAEQRLLIEAKYQAEAKALRDQHTNDQIQKAQEAVRLEWENKISEAALQGQNTLQLEMAQRKAELDALQQMEGESDAAFKSRQLAAQQAYVDSKRSINDYEVQVEQAKMQAIGMVTGALGGLLEEMGENNKAFAIASKALALGEIAINTGKAIAAGTAQAQSVPFPGNLIAIATTVATVLANITTAIKTVKSAKFATGGYVDGPGTATSDSIPAHLSKGESVNNAMSTSMFAPIYSALNQLGGGIPIVATQTGNQVAGEDMLARAVAKGVASLDMRIGVDEIHRVESRVSVVESLGDM